jgi:hypothetical protein
MVKAASSCRKASITLRERVAEHFDKLQDGAIFKERQDKAGSGMYGDRIRTHAMHYHGSSNARSNIKLQRDSVANSDLLAFNE